MVELYDEFFSMLRFAKNLYDSGIEELMKERMEFIGDSMTFSELGEWDHDFKPSQQKTPFDD